MGEGQQMPTGPACGVAIAGGKRQLVVKVDADQFNEIREIAVRNETSMAEAIRLLLEWGLEVAENEGKT